MKLIQVPAATLDQRIKEELEANPALEMGEDQETDADEDTEDFRQEEEPIKEEEKDERADEEIDLTEYMTDDDVADYKMRDTNYPDPDEDRTVPVRVSHTFHESLLQQLGMADLDDRQQHIAEQLIGSIDDDGYLRREMDAIVDDIAFAQNITTTEEELEELLLVVQELDPPGIGARTLQECLLLQLKRKDSNPNTRMAIRVLEDHFDSFAKKHYDRLQKALDLEEDELKYAIDEILKLNPKPGSAYSGSDKGEQYIIPDFTIENREGELVLRLNRENAPELRISSHFREMMKDYTKSDKKDKQQKEAVMFIKQKLDSAKWFIDAIKQRQNTLMSSMNAIMEYQYEFFLTGDETKMRPMILKDIAEETNMDISTISRVANSKYVVTEFGTFPLKYFFSESLTTDSGEEVSTREVKKILQDLIGNESKRRPLSDQRLMELLNEKGYNIARRTVAKYREQLNIPVARLRKEL